MVQDFVDLRADLFIDFNDHSINKNFVDLLIMFIRFQKVSDKCPHAHARNIVPFFSWIDPSFLHNLLK
ncbi:hypothetical protein SAMN02799622_05362 [Methylobacterium sp. UNC378MF]|nr:hypothetical protein SAMN02799622_05362 [Methylobacterium sp. UNC378MF]